MNTAVALTRPPRLPVPAGVAAPLWRVLTEAIFPNAQDPHAILIAMEYCKARNLDILKKPVNIVPQWNGKLKRMVETIWPAITEAQVTAARTHEWAGLDKPVYGPTKTKTFKGRRQDDRGSWINAEVTVTFPEWGEVTVYRIVCGQRCAFTETVHWEEAYGRLAGGELPNAMWTKRPFDQFAKVCKAASLRAAFPEEEGGSPTAEEMEGQIIDEQVVVDAAPVPPLRGQEQDDAARGGGDQPVADPSPGWSPPSEPDHDPTTGEILDDAKPEALGRYGDEDWRDWGGRLMARIRHAKTVDVVDQWMKFNEAMLEALLGEAPKLHANLVASVGRHRASLAPPNNEGQP